MLGQNSKDVEGLVAFPELEPVFTVEYLTAFTIDKLACAQETNGESGVPVNFQARCIVIEGVRSNETVSIDLDPQLSRQFEEWERETELPLPVLVANRQIYKATELTGRSIYILSR